MIWLSLKESKPRIGRQVILRFWGKLYLARFKGPWWDLVLSGERVRAEETDEWIGVN